MAKLLYVTCDLKQLEYSRSLVVGAEFLHAYLGLHPEDEIHMIDLYRDKIQRVDADVLSALEKIRYGHHLAALADDQQRKIVRIWRLADQFAAADKYVFVTPMWNLGFPAELRMYIDTICVVNKTYRYTPAGPEGLLKGMGKKCLLIHSAEGFPLGKEANHSVSYVESVMNFMGIEELDTIAIQGADEFEQRAKPYVGAEIEKAVRLARHF